MGRPERHSIEGLSVLVTRPQEQAQAMLDAIQASGGVAKLFPLFVIEPVTVRPEAFDRLSQFDLMIFISPNAVKHAARFIAANAANLPIIAAIGQATARALEERGFHVAMRPAASFDSEGLLALDAMQTVHAQRVLIVRGREGRETLAEVLRERGAVVEYAEVYQRLKTKQALTNNYADVSAIVVTSSEALRHLAERANEDRQFWVFDKVIVVIHPRIALQAKGLGFTLRPVVVQQQRDRSLEYAVVEALESIQQ